MAAHVFTFICLIDAPEENESCFLPLSLFYFCELRSVLVRNLFFFSNQTRKKGFIENGKCSLIWWLFCYNHNL